MPLPIVIQTRALNLAEMRGYCDVPNSFQSALACRVVEKAGRLELIEHQLESPFRKDYDALEHPMTWPARFDTANWALFAAFRGNERVGGAIAAFNTPDVAMLEGRQDLLVIWDIRVAANARRQGVGAALFGALESWGRKRACLDLKVETQDTNMAACRFYARLGCTLKQADRGAYPELPDEVQLIWTKSLVAGDGMLAT